MNKMLCPYCGREFSNPGEYDDYEELYCDVCDNCFDMEREVICEYHTSQKEQK